METLQSLIPHVLALLATGLTALLALVAKEGKKYLKTKLKENLHHRGAGVVIDSIFQALTELAIDIKKAMADGKLSDKEKSDLKAKAKEISIKHLTELSGFYKKDLVKWVDEQLDTQLGKLQLWALESDKKDSASKTH